MLAWRKENKKRTAELIEFIVAWSEMLELFYRYTTKPKQAM